MDDLIINVLKIHGTDEQVASVREFIKGPNGEILSLNAILRRVMYDFDSLLSGKSVALPADVFMRLLSGEANYAGNDDAFNITAEKPNCIKFNTYCDTPDGVMILLSMIFPDVLFDVSFSKCFAGTYNGYYVISEGAIITSNYYVEDFSDEAIDCHFEVTDYDREEWDQDDNGDWYKISWYQKLEWYRERFTVNGK